MDTPLEGVPSGWESKMGKRHRRKFTDEFKAETVKLIRESGRTVASVARELDLTETAVRSWVKRAEASGSADALATLLTRTSLLNGAGKDGSVHAAGRSAPSAAEDTP